ncbi:hypothetical protein BDV30DRAFT_222008 [Aspergillus minisclerotigenes]|uniref:Uncharacterized protein n=1 Tax=Aspergillus minisclerotigenes TaxID=656917 RepID=A0A5N6IJM0_9EURO|nr:hypothetical protein BDV30DRAFT_222008 [Aspergillus minisclerotigenes]
MSQPEFGLPHTENVEEHGVPSAVFTPPTFCPTDNGRKRPSQFSTEIVVDSWTYITASS